MGEMADLWEKCKELQDALRETTGLMMAYYGYYENEFRISTDPPDVEYLERVEKNQELLSRPISRRQIEP